MTPEPGQIWERSVRRVGHAPDVTRFEVVRVARDALTVKLSDDSTQLWTNVDFEELTYVGYVDARGAIVTGTPPPSPGSDVNWEELLL